MQQVSAVSYVRATDSPEDLMAVALEDGRLSGKIDWILVCELVQIFGQPAASAHVPCSWYTPLHFAVLEGKDEYIRLLVARGARISARCALGFTPLTLAVARSRYSAVRAILACSDRPDASHVLEAMRIARVMQSAGAVQVLSAAVSPVGPRRGDVRLSVVAREARRSISARHEPF